MENVTETLDTALLVAYLSSACGGYRPATPFVKPQYANRMTRHCSITTP